jgi:hypothetical protein
MGYQSLERGINDSEMEFIYQNCPGIKIIFDKKEIIEKYDAEHTFDIKLKDVNLYDNTQSYIKDDIDEDGVPIVISLRFNKTFCFVGFQMTKIDGSKLLKAKSL